MCVCYLLCLHSKPHPQQSGNLIIIFDIVIIFGKIENIENKYKKIKACTLIDIIIILLSIARVAVIKINGLPYLCKTDEVGEICVQTTAAGSTYWGLQGKSTNTFKVQCVTE